MFPFVINYDGREFNTKALKCAYPGEETMYKIALPSALSDNTVCWIANIGGAWKVVMGASLAQGVDESLIASVAKLEAVHTIYPALEKHSLKSA